MEDRDMELRIEHRLTKVEEAIVANTAAVNTLSGHVEVQNGRVGKLEDFRVQIFAVIALFAFSAPFVFFALNQVFTR